MKITNKKFKIIENALEQKKNIPQQHMNESFGLKCDAYHQKQKIM